MLNILDYYTNKQWENFRRESSKHQTPFVLVDLDIVKRNFVQLQKKFPQFKIYYAMKANPHKKIINVVKKLGSYFDVASKNQLKQLLKQGVSADRISYGNTIKKSQDIRYFYKKGVRLFVVDNYNDLLMLSQYAPQSKIFCRFLFDGGNADWSLSKKFGCSSQVAVYLLRKALSMNLVPYGVSFHVGSQQRDVNAWKQALIICKTIFHELQKDDINLKLINMGGGLPANYICKTESLQNYSNQILQFIKCYFPNYQQLQFIMQPGRSLVGNAGILVSQVIQTAEKDVNTNEKWVFIDSGKFNGLIQTLDQAIKYPIYQQNYIQPIYKTILAGPTCDSCDIIYQKHDVKLSDNTKSKDRLYFLTCGAYTSSYASVCFNGFQPIKTICFKEKD